MIFIFSLFISLMTKFEVYNVFSFWIIVIFTNLLCLTLNRRGGQILHPPGFSWITPKIVQLAKQAYRYVNKILFWLFWPNFMMMTSSIQKLRPFCQLSTWGIFNIFYRNLQKKETAVILKRIDQLPQNLARVHNLVGPSEEIIKISIFSILPIVYIVFYCFSIVRHFDTPLGVQDVHDGKIWCQAINYSLLACYRWK